MVLCGEERLWTISASGFPTSSEVLQSLTVQKYLDWFLDFSQTELISVLLNQCLCKGGSGVPVSQ